MCSRKERKNGRVILSRLDDVQPHWRGKSAESKNSYVNLYQETSINNFKLPHINIENESLHSLLGVKRG